MDEDFLLFEIKNNDLVNDLIINDALSCVNMHSLKHNS